MIKPSLLDAKSHRNRSHDRDMKLATLLEKAQHLPPESAPLRILRPAVRQTLHTLAPDLKRLLEILALELTDARNLSLVGQISGLLASLGDISAIGFRGGPGKSVLF